MWYLKVIYIWFRSVQHCTFTFLMVSIKIPVLSQLIPGIGDTEALSIKMNQTNIFKQQAQTIWGWSLSLLLRRVNFTFLWNVSIKKWNWQWTRIRRAQRWLRQCGHWLSETSCGATFSQLQSSDRTGVPRVCYEQCRLGTREADKPTGGSVPVPGTYRFGVNV